MQETQHTQQTANLKYIIQNEKKPFPICYAYFLVVHAVYFVLFNFSTKNLFFSLSRYQKITHKNVYTTFKLVNM